MLLLSHLLLSALTVAEPQSAQRLAGVPQAAKTPAIVAWQELSKHPSRFLGQEVRLRVQIHSRVESWNPYVTRFGSLRFAAFQAWADEQLPWVRSDYDAPAARLFVRRGGASEWALAEAKTYARFEVLVAVREVFLDRPWIEVLEVVPLAERITEGTVIHAGRASELMNDRSWKLAESELEQALAGSPPPVPRAELERLRERCRQAVAEAGTAGRAIDRRRLR